MTDEQAFEIEIEVHGTPEDVWTAIATGPGVSAWLQPTEIEEEVGGRFAYDLGGQSRWNETGTVSAYDAPHRFASTGVQWQGPGGPEDVSILATEWIIEPREGGTCVVRLLMSGFKQTPDWDDEVGGVRNAMRDALTALQTYLG